MPPNYWSCWFDMLESSRFLLFALRNLEWNQNRRFFSHENRLRFIRLLSLAKRKLMLRVPTKAHWIEDSGIVPPFLLNEVNFNVPIRAVRYCMLIRQPLCRIFYKLNSSLRNTCKKLNSLSGRVMQLLKENSSKASLMRWLSDNT